MSEKAEAPVPEVLPAAESVLFEGVAAQEGYVEPAAADAPAPAGAEPAKAEPLDLRELKAILETLLFVSHGPVTVERLASVLEGVPKIEVRQALRSLQDEYDQVGRGLQVVEVAGGFQLVTRSDYGPWIKRLEKNKPRSALESLAIIAYKQPIVRAEIEQIRSVEASGVIRTLLERKLIRMVGRKDMPGRPIMYGTTKYFLQHFGLRDLSELPPLREFKELGESEQELLPVGDEPLVVAGSDPAAGEPAAESLEQETLEQV
jgi:segregation and condensation protein B